MELSANWLMQFLTFLPVYTLESICVTKLGVKGTCKPISDCLSLIAQLKSYEGLDDLSSCASDNNDSLFCCPSTYLPAKFSRSNKLCDNIEKLRYQLMPNIPVYNKNSSSISIGELPFIAQVIFPERGFVGVGVLISSNFLLTSAHILLHRRSMPIIRLGKVIRSINLRKFYS